MRNKLLMVLLIGVLLALLAVPTCAADADFTEESMMETSADYEDCIYGDKEIVMGLDGTVLEGDMPKKQLKLISAWIALHEDELAANWQMLRRRRLF